MLRDPRRSAAPAAVIGWLIDRACGVLLVYRSYLLLRRLRDDELRELGLTQADVERAGWF